MAETGKVVFATDEVTVHTLLSPDPQENQFGDKVYHTESRVLLPGQSVGLDEVPPYLLESIKDGTSPGLELMTEKRAADVAQKAAEIRAAASGEAINVQGVPSESDANKKSLKLAADSVGDEEEPPVEEPVAPAHQAEKAKAANKKSE